jgi:von Willebrand factor type A domain
VVFDLTESMELADRAKQALIERIEQLPEHSYVGIMRAQDGLRVLLDPTTDRKAVAAAIAEVPVSGKAGLLETVETIETIADSILSKAAIRVAVFYVTDSEVSNYREDFTNPVINSSDSHDLSRRFPEQLIQEKIAKMEANLAGRQAPLFIVHLDYRSDRLNEAYQNGLRRLAEVTGGSALVCRSVVEIPESIRNVFTTIDSHYSVSLLPPQRTAKSVAVELGLAETANGNGRSLSYRTRFVFK